ncbi:P-loop containing nucleoside triphosphate hydrolase protein, partial [Auriculariales sp. MPI-PUGE-AT-0066]
APAAEHLRVITTIGHVDHGKTTFVDSLLAANNIISSRLAGKIRYMDSREDEQQRGITMESSAVSLQFKVLDRNADGTPAPRTYVVNLIDTPGHVDFSSEVSTAARLCDGALVLVDVVEGVCTQASHPALPPTITVLRQAWLDRLKPVLVINKFDRLITELKLTPTEGYQHLLKLIEEVNAVMGSFFAAERLEDDLRWREEREKRLAARKEAASDTVAEGDADADDFTEKDDEDIYFAPNRGNVIFASAIDGWGFRVGKFAQLHAQKLGVKEAILRRVLWGDFYLDPKTKRVVDHKQLKGRNLKPLFVQFVLDNIWAVYENVVINPNPEKIEKIVSALNLKIPPRDLSSKDSRHVLSQIFGQWLSLSTCTVQAVIDIVPPPTVAQRTRVPKMLHPDLHEATKEPQSQLEEDLYSCNSKPGASIVGYVSKMFAVSRKELPESKRKPLTAEEMRARAKLVREQREAGATAAQETPTPAAEATDAPAGDAAPSSDEVLLGFTRLYSGTIHVGSTLICVLPKYKPDLGRAHPHNARHLAETTVTALYVMMGRELLPVETVSAGNVFAIAGLEGKVWRSATLCGAEGANDQSLVNLGSVNRQAPPIVRVSLEPVIPSDMPKVVQGLKLLSQADPCVEVFQQQTGEHVILTAGELHLERCLKDLRERFAKVEIQASEPIVPFRETAIKGADMAPPKAGAGRPRGTIQSTAGPQSAVKYTLRVVPLPPAVTALLISNASLLQRLGREAGSEKAEAENELAADQLELEENAEVAGESFGNASFLNSEDFTSALKTAFDDAGGDWKDAYDAVWMFGPHSSGPNVLLDQRPTSERRQHYTRRKEQTATGVQRDLEDALERGFQTATFQGPLCAEPIQGMAISLQALELDDEIVRAESAQSRLGQLIGAVSSSVREACRNGLLDWSPRLMLAMYSCEIQASTEVLGKMYGVLARRRGKVISEEIKEGTAFFTVRAMLPVVESFGFADDIRKKTSGAASPQLVFNGYEMLDEDPYWVPTTEEELEDLGEKADRANVARAYMDTVRSRKGMFVEKKIVEFAEKQRTLKR